MFCVLVADHGKGEESSAKQPSCADGRPNHHGRERPVLSFSTEEAAKGLHLPLLREGEVVDDVVIVDND